MENKNIIIIGGGIAGMSAGIYAQKNGFNATILESHDRPGGQLTAWDRDGYRFDYCLHWLVGTDHGTYNDIWREIGAIDDKVEIINHEVFTRLVDEKLGEFVIYNDLDKWEEYLVELAPEDEAGIRKMCGMMRKGDLLDQYEDPPGMRSIWEHVHKAWHIGSFVSVLFRYGKKNCAELFNDLELKNEKLLYFFNQLFGGRDFSAIAFVIMMGWFHAKNAGYLIGGSAKMAGRIAYKFHSLGGEFKFGTRVKEIVVKNDKAIGVKLENDTFLMADHVISACDGRTVLYDMLKGNYLTDQLKDAYENWELFTPVVMASFGIDMKLPGDQHATNYLKQDTTIGSTKIKSMNILNRSAYDPTFAPEGKSAVLVMFESPWENWEHLEGEAYQNEKQQIQNDITNELEKLFPGFKDKIEVVDIATPKTTARYTGVWKGSYEGFAPQGDVLNGLPMQLEGLENFTMIGQWMFPGGGLPPSAQSGKWAIQMLCKAEHEEFEHA